MILLEKNLILFLFRMLSRPVRQAPRVIARLASSEAASSANEGAKKSSNDQSKINVPAVAVAVGAVGLGLSKLLGR